MIQSRLFSYGVRTAGFQSYLLVQIITGLKTTESPTTNACHNADCCSHGTLPVGVVLKVQRGLVSNVFSPIPWYPRVFSFWY